MRSSRPLVPWGRLDELVYRARLRHLARTRRAFGSGYTIQRLRLLPACTDEVNSDLVRVYVDAQHDYLNDRIYMLGSLVVVSDNGVESGRSSPIVHATAARRSSTPMRRRCSAIG
ncbi:MAG: hypothetical protein WKH64_08400 [Chloroflexia bacterium]